MGIKSDIQIDELDIMNFENINSTNDLRLKIENIKEKIAKIKTQL